jgi:hypothetical protein
MSVARKPASLCVQNWRSRSAFIRKLVLQNNLRSGASPPHASLQLGGLALPATSPKSEIRSTKSETNSKHQILNLDEARFVLRILSLFRVSDFEFRICVFAVCQRVSASVRRLSLTTYRVTSCDKKKVSPWVRGETTSLYGQGRPPPQLGHMTASGCSKIKSDNRLHQQPLLATG